MDLTGQTTTTTTTTTTTKAEAAKTTTLMRIHPPPTSTTQLKRLKPTQQKQQGIVQQRRCFLVLLLPAFQCVIVVLVLSFYQFDILKRPSSVRSYVVADDDEPIMHMTKTTPSFSSTDNGNGNGIDIDTGIDTETKQQADEDILTDVNHQQPQQQKQKQGKYVVSGSYDDPDKKYLLFFTHSGFSNQLIGLQRAAQIAYYTSRILVLPPVLPHQPSTQNSRLRYNFLGTPGRKCPAGETPQQIIKDKEKKIVDMFRMTQRNAVMAQNNTSRFPSWKALIDFDVLMNETGIQVIDMPEFMTDVCRGRTDSWSFGKEKVFQYDGRCDNEEGKPLPYEQMLDLLTTNFNNNTDKIAFIGSAFNIRSYPKEDPIFDIFNHAFMAYVPSTELSLLFNYLRSKLPHEYGGIHVRLPDAASWKQPSTKKKPSQLEPESKGTIGVVCPPAKNPNINNMYDEVVKMVKNGTNEVDFTRKPTSVKTHWFVGTSHEHAKGCFDYFMKQTKLMTDRTENIENVTALLLSDLMKGDPVASSMADKIRTEPSTLGLVLDQLLLSSADTVHTVSDSFGSTFQSIINRRHKMLQQQ